MNYVFIDKQWNKSNLQGVQIYHFFYSNYNITRSFLQCLSAFYLHNNYEKNHTKIRHIKNHPTNSPLLSYKRSNLKEKKKKSFLKILIDVAK